MGAPEDRLCEVIAAARSRKNVPFEGHEPRLRLISLGRDQPDIEARVRALQQKVSARTGIDLMVVGGGYGCFRIVVVAKNVAGIVRELAHDRQFQQDAREAKFDLLIYEDAQQNEYERIDLRWNGGSPVVDFAIITALRDPEFAELRKQLRAIAPQELMHEDGPFTYYEYEVAADSGAVYRVRASFLQQMGNAAAATYMTHVLKEWGPTYTILCGIAGSLQPKWVRLGDAVVASQVFNYDDRRKESSKTRLAPQGFPTDRTLLTKAENFLADDEWRAAWQEQNADGNGWRPDIHVGDLATGNAVIDSAKMRKQLLNADRKLLAVEMEAGGVLEAAVSQQVVAKVMIVRGISDEAAKKDVTPQVWRGRAARSAASFACSFIRRFRLRGSTVRNTGAGAAHNTSKKEPL